MVGRLPSSGAPSCFTRSSSLARTSACCEGAASGTESATRKSGAPFFGGNFSLNPTDGSSFDRFGRRETGSLRFFLCLRSELLRGVFIFRSIPTLVVLFRWKRYYQGRRILARRNENCRTWEESSSLFQGPRTKTTINTQQTTYLTAALNHSHDNGFSASTLQAAAIAAEACAF